jgi:hypothetical protein
LAFCDGVATPSYAVIFFSAIDSSRNTLSIRAMTPNSSDGIRIPVLQIVRV